MLESTIRKTFVRQQDQRDCGVACLLSLVRFYGGDSNFEEIRRLSGSDISGTSLLGLKEAAVGLGLEAEGFEADLPSLVDYGKPVILHVALDNGQQHYVIFYGAADRTSGSDKFIIGDPGLGVRTLTGQELEKIWRSRICLAAGPDKEFKKTSETNSLKVRWLIDHLREDGPILWICAGMGVGLALLGLAMAVYSQQLIDKIIPEKNSAKIISSTVLVIVLLFFRVGLMGLRQYFLLRQNREFGIRLNSSFYEKLLHLPKPFFDSRKVGDFVARLNDTSRIKNALTSAVGNILVDGMVVIACIGLVVYYDWIVGLIAILILPVYFVIIYSQTGRIIDSQKNVMVAYSLSESNYINSINGISDVKSNNKQAFFAGINTSLYGASQEMSYRSGLVQLRTSMIAGLAAVSVIGITLFITIYQVFQKDILIGEMTAILGAISGLLPAIGNLALVTVPLQDARVAFDRMYEFGNISSPTVEKQAGESIYLNSLDINNLSFRFPGKRQLINNISLSIRRGEIVSIVSESGGGKSIFCQIIQKFYQPESGEILLNESVPLDTIDEHTWNNILGVVPQHVHLFNGTIIHNICLTENIQDIQAAFELLNEYGFTPFFETLPQGALTTIGEDGTKLSGGQRQLIGLARVLVRRPQLLILDEATASLDRDSEKFVLDLLQKLKADLGIIFITHRLHTLKAICDRIYLLEKGTFSAVGNHNELMFSSNLYSRYWFAWTKGNVGSFQS